MCCVALPCLSKHLMDDTNYLTTFLSLQPVQSLTNRYARRVKKGSSIPGVKDGEMRETSSEPEEASFVLQADALQVRSEVHVYVHVYMKKSKPGNG